MGSPGDGSEKPCWLQVVLPWTVGQPGDSRLLPSLSAQALPFCPGVAFLPVSKWALCLRLSDLGTLSLSRVRPGADARVTELGARVAGLPAGFCPDEHEFARV